MKKLFCHLFGHTEHHTCRRCGLYRHLFIGHDGGPHYDTAWLIQQPQFKQHLAELHKLFGGGA